MNCPKCNGKTLVVDSRLVSLTERMRRRVCQDCGYRFTLYEKIEEKPVVKKLQKRYVSQSERRNKGCDYCVDVSFTKNGARCPFEKCPY